MITIILGPPGAGKGTQAILLSRRLGMNHISTGDLLREARMSDTSLGNQAARFLDAGTLVPDSLVSALVAERISKESTPLSARWLSPYGETGGRSGGHFN